jgi:hypothetical protein
VKRGYTTCSSLGSCLSCTPPIDGFSSSRRLAYGARDVLIAQPSSKCLHAVTIGQVPLSDGYSSTLSDFSNLRTPSLFRSTRLREARDRIRSLELLPPRCKGAPLDRPKTARIFLSRLHKLADSPDLRPSHLAIDVFKTLLRRHPLHETAS